MNHHFNFDPIRSTFVFIACIFVLSEFNNSTLKNTLFLNVASIISLGCYGMTYYWKHLTNVFTEKAQRLYENSMLDWWCYCTIILFSTAMNKNAFLNALASCFVLVQLTDLLRQALMLPQLQTKNSK